MEFLPLFLCLWATNIEWDQVRTASVAAGIAELKACVKDLGGKRTPERLGQNCRCPRFYGFEVVGDAFSHDGYRLGQTFKKIGRASESRARDAPNASIHEIVGAAVHL